MEKNTYQALLRSALGSTALAAHHISSFEYFIDKGLNKIIESEGLIEPVIKPVGVEDFKIKINKITIGKPDIIEADSIVRNAKNELSSDKDLRP